MKRAKTTSTRRREIPMSNDPVEAMCLERLCHELDHPDESRRRGARAVMSWLGRLADLHANERSSSADAQRALDQKARRSRAANHDLAIDQILSACAACGPRKSVIVQPPRQIGVVQEIDALERSILERERARRTARADGTPEIQIVLN